MSLVRVQVPLKVLDQDLSFRQIKAINTEVFFLKHSPYETRESVELHSEGMKLFGVLHRPLHIKKPPIVLICHGFAGTKVGRFRMFVALSELLVRSGIAVFRFDFRGSGDSEGEFTEMTISGEVKDAEVALNYIDSHPDLDQDRLGILGKSLGGLVAVIAASKRNHVKSMALWAPAYHASQWEEQWTLVRDPSTSQEMRAKLMQFDGTHANPLFLKEFFSLNLEGDLKKLDDVPLLHIHGEQDDAVNLSHAIEYERVRSGSTSETRLIRLPRSDHDFSDLDEQQLTLSETHAWFKRTL